MNQALIDDPEFDAWLKKRTPAGRWGRVEELVGACIFLASAASDFVNGQIALRRRRRARDALSRPTPASHPTTFTQGGPHP